MFTTMIIYFMIRIFCGNFQEMLTVQMRVFQHKKSLVVTISETNIRIDKVYVYNYDYLLHDNKGTSVIDQVGLPGVNRVFDSVPSPFIHQTK